MAGNWADTAAAKKSFASTKDSAAAAAAAAVKDGWQRICCSLQKDMHNA
jgi:hypothetical protein